MEMNLIQDGIRVTVEVSLSNVKGYEQMGITISPDATTLLPQVKTLMQRVQARARAMMLREMAGKFMEISVSGVFPEYKYQTIQAHAELSIGSGLVTILNSPAVEFVPAKMAEACIFGQEDIERAKEALLIQLLAGFAVLGGAHHEHC